MATLSSSRVTTSYLLGNLHCPSCVTLIKSILLEESPFQSHVHWVSPNLVTSVVTVEHDDDSKATVRNMARSLEDAGFEICGVNTTAVQADDLDRESLDPGIEGSTSRATGSGLSSSWVQSIDALGAWAGLWRPRPSSSASRPLKDTHLENCEACREAAKIDVDPGYANGLSKEEGKAVALVSEKDSSATTLKGIAVDDDTASSSWQASISIGGMTCASCSNTVTEELQKLPWVSRVLVNLVNNSASVDFSEPGKARDIVDAIEDLGYDASINKVVDLSKEILSSDQREVDIKVEGIFCGRCPVRISQTLETFGPERLEVLHKPSLQHPLLKIRYQPHAPNFTIRHILRSIEATDSRLKASIFHAPTLEEKSKLIQARHQKQLLWREILTIIVAIPTFILGIVYMSLLPSSDPSRTYLMQPWTSGLSRIQVALCVLATPVYFFAADIFHRRAAKELYTIWRPGSRTSLAARFFRFGSMNMLMSLGTTIAYFSSVAQMIVVATSHEAHVSDDQFYFDSVVFLTLFLLAGRLIESYSKAKTGNAVEALANLRPSTALLIEADHLNHKTTSTITVDLLEAGDVITVPNGSSPAADGVITSGSSTFDESSLTGESRPVEKVPGEQVFSGTINKGSAVTIRISGPPGKSMLDQIVEVVREGQTRRAPIEQIADTLTTYFVPVVTLIAIVTWGVWMALALSGTVAEVRGQSTADQVSFAFKFAIAVFVIACPCGLALAAPTAIFVGGGLAAKHGILAKGGGEAFELASKVDCVVFDKTGTLTEGGSPKVTDSIFLATEQSGEKTRLLAIVKALEQNSSHPVAKAIVEFCGSDARAPELTDIEEIPGRGMKATNSDDKREILVGNELLMEGFQVSITSEVAERLQTWKTEAKSVALVATKMPDEKAWRLAAALSISDAIRAEAAGVVKTLHALKINVWMLSGDNMTTARAVASRVGIPEDHVLAEVLPSEKADKIKYLQTTLTSSIGSRRATVAMVGDGINDSPALTTADVGIAIGTGSDVALSSSAFVLTSTTRTSRPSLLHILTLLELSRAVLRRVRANFYWALVYNVLAVPVAAGCLYAVKTGGSDHVVLDPAWASLAMAASSISVVLSSLSLRSRIPGLGFRERRGRR